MEQSQKNIAQLIQLHLERADGYSRAVDAAKDNDFRIIFSRFSNQSRVFANALKVHIVDCSKIELGVSTSGITLWNDLKNKADSATRYQTLTVCEMIESGSLSLYDQALNEMLNAPGDILSLLRQQRMAMHEGKDMVAAMKNRAARN